MVSVPAPTTTPVLTDEQLQIVHSRHDLKINACAGSGKTTTLIQYAAQQPASCRILYLAFNKSVRLEAQHRFSRHGLTNYDTIRGYTQQLWEKMNDGAIAVSHDFYLKKFQLLQPQLPYDLILFDEGQDASETMLTVFLAQKARKVIVGDVNQQIYGFRFAVNSLQRVDFPTRHLSTSFRFDQSIADLANLIINWKKRVDPDFSAVAITGLGAVAPTGLSACIGRTNLSVLAEAIHVVCVQQSVQRVYFEGHFDTYTYMDGGGSLYDILNLYTGRFASIKNPLIRDMRGVEELKEYIDLTGEQSLKLGLEIVQTYSYALPDFIQQIKNAHLSDAQRRQADRIFSTVHRCKGLEYDSVTINDDFITYETVEAFAEKFAPYLSGEVTLKNDQELAKLLFGRSAKPILQAHQVSTPGSPQNARHFSPFDNVTLIKEKLYEEIHMLYVAVTRSRHDLLIPRQLGLMLEEYQQFLYPTSPESRP